ncbi:metallo-peptidase Clan MA(E) Family M41 [Perkinsela sp. CCAP 1560/4]|nr:metallo-peptidase Clan MA(E) Family M41 [Perkinsela sp. CCAP 1560/4]|eukprot:KNH04808.1 metallo-peptidase Clan MA(E) Family M41 [Perkinsela sp. CCAP 1560/4]
MAGSSGLASLWSSNEPKPMKLDSFHTTFSDVRGCDEAKEELEEIVLFLKDPQRFRRLGGKLPKGALLVGPPGCGKTMLAKAIAKEADVSFFYCSGSEFDEMFVGVGARRIRDLFTAAKNNGPSLIFIDEIDAIGSSRTAKDMSYSRMTLNQLLAEMDGFNSSDEVIVIAATNTPDTLDKALVRPGRLDRHISVDPPDLKGRQDILDLYLSKIKLHPKEKMPIFSKQVARGSIGFTGADLQNLVNLAAIRAVMLDKEYVTMDEMEYARDRVMMGAENHSKRMSESEKRNTAYHEGGHALVAMLLENQGADPVHKATIVPRGSGILGLVQQLPEGDRYSTNRQQMITRITVALAGRVAEELIFGKEKTTSGALSDFQQASKIARNMVRRFGFNDEKSLGPLDYESTDTATGAYISEKTKEAIEEQTKNIVTTSYHKATELLTVHKAKLDLIADALLEFETLTGDELKYILKQPKTNIKAIVAQLRSQGKQNAHEIADKSRLIREKAMKTMETGGKSKPPKQGGISIPIFTSKAKKPTES